MLHIELVTLFPAMFDALTEQGVVGRAIKQGLARLNCVNPRDFTQDSHRTVDDRPYGGGPGMLMMVEPLLAAVRHSQKQLASAGCKAPKVVYLSPQGQQFSQQKAQQISESQGLILVCGRYEGVDERFINEVVDEEWSIGDFVVSGGELPAMLMLDAAIRLLPGALGHGESAQQDSFVGQLLDCPHYTRPEDWQGNLVPPVLLSGDHKKIRRWRLAQSLERTVERRPDLLRDRAFDNEETDLLAAYWQGRQYD